MLSSNIVWVKLKLDFPPSEDSLGAPLTFVFALVIAFFRTRRGRRRRMRPRRFFRPGGALIFFLCVAALLIRIDNIFVCVSRARRHDWHDCTARWMKGFFCGFTFQLCRPPKREN